MDNVWPKLLITCDTTIGTSYWHIPSKEYLDRLCIEWVLTNLENGWYSDERFEGSLVEFVADKFKVDLTAAASILENGDEHRYALKAEYEFHDTRQKLFMQCIEAIKTLNGDIARDALEKYSDLYEKDVLGKNFFKLVDYTTCEIREIEDEDTSPEQET